MRGTPSLQPDDLSMVQEAVEDSADGYGTEHVFAIEWAESVCQLVPTAERVEFEILRHGTDEPNSHTLLRNLALVEKDTN